MVDEAADDGWGVGLGDCTGSEVMGKVESRSSLHAQPACHWRCGPAQGLPPACNFMRCLYQFPRRRCVIVLRVLPVCVPADGHHGQRALLATLPISLCSALGLSLARCGGSPSGADKPVSSCREPWIGRSLSLSLSLSLSFPLCTQAGCQIRPTACACQLALSWPAIFSCPSPHQHPFALTGRHR